jgi:hypothetical protein
MPDRLVEHVNAVRIERVGPGDRHRSEVGADLDADDGVMPVAVVPRRRLRIDVVDFPVVDRRQTPSRQGT